MTHEQLVEMVAQAVYEHWNFYPADAGKDCTPWVSGGNSYRQEQARDYARAALSVVYEAMEVSTRDMNNAGAYVEYHGGGGADRIYEAMLAASPLNPERE